jgi:hypothetical protein
MSYKIPTGGHFLITSGALLNPNTLTEDITMPSNYNAVLVGPVTVPQGVVLDVKLGATLVIV